MVVVTDVVHIVCALCIGLKLQQSCLHVSQEHLVLGTKYKLSEVTMCIMSVYVHRYGKAGVQFFTNTKTVTTNWKSADEAIGSKAPGLAGVGADL